MEHVTLESMANDAARRHGSMPAFRDSAARGCAGWLLVLLASLTAGCGQRPARSHATAAPADFSAPPASSAGAASPAPAGSPAPTASTGPTVPRMVIGRFVSPPETAQAPVQLDTSEPTAEYASLEAVRDTIEAILRRSVRLPDTAIHFRRERVEFDYHWSKGSAAGWAFHVIVNDTTPCPHDKLLDALRAAGWANNWDYSADGPDGEDMGMVTHKYLCVMEAQWDGGDDMDTTYVPPPWCKVTVTCVPRRLDDVYPK